MSERNRLRCMGGMRNLKDQDMFFDEQVIIDHAQIAQAEIYHSHVVGF